MSTRNGQVVPHIAGGPDVSAQQLLIAVGRHPDTSGLGLDAAGRRTGEHGFVVVDKHLATTNEHVYAASEVTGLFDHTTSPTR